MIQKINHILAILLPILLIHNFLLAQNLAEKLNNIKTAVSQVTVKDVVFDQSLDFLISDGYIITLKITESKRGKSTEYRFNLVDLDQKKIKFDTRKNLAIVDIGTKSDKKVIYNLVDGKVSNYLNKISIKATGVESARNLSDLLKTATEDAEKEQINFYQEKSDLVSLLAYLENILGKVSINDDTYEQSFSFQPDNKTIVKFNSNHSNKNINESFQLSFSDVNPGKIDFTTRGNAILIEIETQGKKNLVEYEKNGALVGFKNKITLRANTIEEGRKIASALTNLKALADVNPVVLFKEDATLAESIDFLINHIKTISRNDNVFEQSLSQSGNGQFVVKKFDKGKESTQEYTFNPSDINSAKINFDTKGTDILVELESRAKKPLIKYVVNGQVENYRTKFDIHAGSIELGRAQVNALKRLAQLSKENDKTFLINGKENLSIKESLDFLIQQIVDVHINDKIFKQSLFYEEDKPEIITFESLDTDRDEKKTYELNLKDLNVATIEFNTKGREVIITAEIKGKQDLIKTSKNDEDDKYSDTLMIKSAGIEEARKIVHTLKYLVNQFKG